MSEVVIRNKALLEVLDSFVDDMLSRPDYNNSKYWAYSSPDDMSRGEYYCSDEFLKQLFDDNKLIGAPHKHFAQPIAKMVRSDESWQDYMQRVKYDFAAEIGAHTSALLSFYPPGGFVGWHTNWDANAYQVLFTWSENGDGYFRYYDKEKDEIVTIQDVPGWQCRHFYFGSKDEPEHHCWHSAYNGKGQRITLAYKFCNAGSKAADPIKDQQARDLRDMLIEDIETE